MTLARARAILAKIFFIHTGNTKSSYTYAETVAGKAISS